MRTAQDFMVEIHVLKDTDQMTKARQVLRDDRFREVYIVDAKKNLLGYIDITDGLRVTATKSNITIEGFVREAPRALPEDPIEKVAKMMKQYRTDSAAVMDSASHIAGGVLLADLFPVIISRNELHGPVSRYMSTDVEAAGPDDELQKVSALIVESGFAAFPVLAKKKLVGLISRRDLISSRKVRTAIAQHAGTTIGDVMTREVFTIGADEPISAAAELIVKHDVSLLPVTGDGRVVGVVNRHDVLGALA
jgi:CBS domain-containing protein